MGMIYKRGETYWIKYYKNGKSFRESTRSKKKMVAKSLLNKREGEIAIGKMPGIHFDKVTFQELAADFLVEYRVNKRKTIIRAELSVKILTSFFGAYRAVDITTPKIHKYIENRLETVAPSTVNRELAALKRMLNLGARQTPPKVDRVPYIPMLKEINVRKGFFEHGEFLAVREALPDYLRGFLTFGYKTGWRLGEIKNLVWSNIDMMNGVVRLEVGDTKNDDGRTVYLDDELKATLEKQHEAKVKRGTLTPYVFTNEQGDKIKEFRAAWNNAFKETEIPKKLFHDLRRTAVRNMIRAGIPERVAMMVSGHKTRSVFDRYNIVALDDLKQAAQRQERYLNEQKANCAQTVPKLCPSVANLS